MSLSAIVAQSSSRSPDAGSRQGPAESGARTPGGGDGGRAAGPRPFRRPPGFVPGNWKRNTVVGLSYLLAALVVFGGIRYALGLF
jgi:hypothetical protein